MKGKLRLPKELIKNGFAPHVYIFKNVESGQVLYSQVPYHTDVQINLLFPTPNWQNKKPKNRPDLWRIMAVAEFENHDIALQAYKGLVHLRYLRDVNKKKEAESYRKRNEQNNIWYAGQFRPTWSQEAVADIATVIESYKLDTVVHWENLWRKGEDKHWDLELVTHRELPPFNPRDQHVLLDELRKKAVLEFQKSRDDMKIPENFEAKESPASV